MYSRGIGSSETGEKQNDIKMSIPRPARRLPPEYGGSVFAPMPDLPFEAEPVALEEPIAEPEPEKPAEAAVPVKAGEKNGFIQSILGDDFKSEDLLIIGTVALMIFGQTSDEIILMLILLLLVGT